MYRLNRWYDRLGEPWRFLVFFVPLLAMIIVGAYGTSHGEVWAMLVGYLPMAGLILMRLWYFWRARLMADRKRLEYDRNGPTIIQGGKR